MTSGKQTDLKPYELAVVLHPDLEIDLKSSAGKIEDLVKNTGGKIVAKDEWGKQKLAYPVVKQGHGIYIFYQVELSPEAIADLEDGLKISDEVMRFLLVKPLEIEEEAEEAKKSAKVASVAKASDNKDNSAKE